ncbi:hypothetical protein Tco_0214626 [Tanacetum coccineum]
MLTPMSSDTKLTKDEEVSVFVHASKRIPKSLILKRLSVSSDTLKVKNMPRAIIGQSVFITEWALDSLSAYQESDGPYHIELPTPEEIHQCVIPILPPLPSIMDRPLINLMMLKKSKKKETDIRQKDEKSSENRQNRARNGKA